MQERFDVNNKNDRSQIHKLNYKEKNDSPRFKI